MTGSDKNTNDFANFAEIEFDHRKQFVVLQHITPYWQDDPYHFHPSIEINFLTDCDMTYSFSGEEFELKRGHLCVFWATRPHRPVQINGTGKITNAYVNLAEFLRWDLPTEFVSAILRGVVVTSTGEIAGDAEMTARWAKEIDHSEPEWQRLHALEIQSRLQRLAIDGWSVMLEPSGKTDPSYGGEAVNQVALMLQYVAEHYSQDVSVTDVAVAAGLSQNNAMILFKKILKRTIKEYITDIRIFQAKVSLAETDKKILTIAQDCGFRSQSAFYAAFQRHTSEAPAQFRENARAQTGM